MSKFKVGDRVRVVFNKLQPGTVGRVGEVTKVYHDAEDNQALYKVRLDGCKTPLKGVAEEDCIELVK